MVRVTRVLITSSSSSISLIYHSRVSSSGCARASWLKRVQVVCTLQWLQLTGWEWLMHYSWFTHYLVSDHPRGQAIGKSKQEDMQNLWTLKLIDDERGKKKDTYKVPLPRRHRIYLASNRHLLPSSYLLLDHHNFFVHKQNYRWSVICSFSNNITCHGYWRIFKGKRWTYSTSLHSGNEYMKSIDYLSTFAPIERERIYNNCSWGEATISIWESESHLDQSARLDHDITPDTPYRDRCHWLVEDVPKKLPLGSSTALSPYSYWYFAVSSSHRDPSISGFIFPVSAWALFDTKNNTPQGSMDWLGISSALRACWRSLLLSLLTANWFQPG